VTRPNTQRGASLPADPAAIHEAKSATSNTPGHRIIDESTEKANESPWSKENRG
jgi:hypothetical protein